MPIVASRGLEIRRLIEDLEDPKRRPGAVLRLRSMGARVVPHVGDVIKEIKADARRALLEALQGVDTEDARTLKRRLTRIETTPAKSETPPARPAVPPAPSEEGEEALALETIRRLPPPRADESASTSRSRGEAHLTLARLGSRLARKDLLQTLQIVGAARARLCCEAAGLIGNAEFLPPLAQLAAARPEALEAIAAIASREHITARSKAMRDLDPALRPIIAKALTR